MISTKLLGGLCRSLGRIISLDGWGILLSFGILARLSSMVEPQRAPLCLIPLTTQEDCLENGSVQPSHDEFIWLL